MIWASTTILFVAVWTSPIQGKQTPIKPEKAYFQNLEKKRQPSLWPKHGSAAMPKAFPGPNQCQIICVALLTD